jgi:phage tail sheath protein FI
MVDQMADRVTPPGVDVEQQGVPVIAGVATSITAFIGRTPIGPAAPTLCVSFAEFQQNFGGLAENYPLTSAVQDFFVNGGTDAIVVRVSPSGGGALSADDLIGREDQHTGISALDGVDLFNLLCIPPDRGDFADADLARVYQKAAAYCGQRRAMLIADPPQKWSAALRAGKLDDIQPTDLGIGEPAAASCAVYFPRIEKPIDAAGTDVAVFPASGAIAGVFAASDERSGVWKAPAGIAATIGGIVDIELPLTDQQNGELNVRRINCLRNFSSVGPVVWGARTLRTVDDDYKYVPVRRLAWYIEESIYRGTAFAAFEPNGQTLWSKVNGSVSGFMTALWREGGLFGASAAEAYFVRCDQTTMTPADIANGTLNIVVGFAPVKPAEFVVLQIQQIAGQAQA